MSVSITALYAAILALIMMALGINVTVHRVKLKVSLGDGGNPQMLRMIRLHANAVEYLPIALILMALYELNAGWPLVLHVIGGTLILGRLLQTLGMWLSDAPGPARGTGQTLTWASIVALAFINLGRLV